MNKIKFIAIKEFHHIIRDSRSLIIVILIPILMTFLFGYAINLDVKNIKLAIIDYDKSFESRDLAGKFYNSGYFIKTKKLPDIAGPEKVLMSGDANAVLIIRSGFAKALANHSDYELGISVDGSDANLAAAASSYSKIVLIQFLAGQFTAGESLANVVMKSKIVYNPNLKSSHFFIPGLIAVILMMISALLASITITREKENGTMEQLLTSPVVPRQIILGKIAPYIILAFLDGLLILVFAIALFGVPFKGSILLLLFFGLLYLATALSLGILISTLVKTQQVAMMLSLLITVLPSVMLSGYIFEIKNMPTVMQWLSRLIPARYFILMIRGIMIKGAGMAELWTESIFLILLAVVLLALAIKRFQLKIG
jgi:ABC-2 type transport system permease protein